MAYAPFVSYFTLRKHCSGQYSQNQYCPLFHLILKASRQRECASGLCFIAIVGGLFSYPRTILYSVLICRIENKKPKLTTNIKKVHHGKAIFTMKQTSHNYISTRQLKKSYYENYRQVIGGPFSICSDA
jgi:hypothetical protein